MADNVSSEAIVSAGQTWAVIVASFSGDTAGHPLSVNALASGSEGSWTVTLPVANSGNLSAGVQRVCIATDDVNLSAIKTSVETLDNAISGSEMQVDVVGSLPAGTNAIGKLAANSGVDIGDVDVTSIIPGTGATNLGKAIDTATGATDTGVLTLATRDDALSSLTPAEGDNVQLRVDANGALWCILSGTVTVASHAVTNAGTFVVQIDGTALTRLTDIETNTDSGAVVGNGAAATAQRVTLANDSTGIVALTTSTASIGKLASNSGVTIGAVEIATAQTLATVTTVTTCSTVTTLTGGGVAHDSADSGNPHKIGYKAESSPKGITLVADGDRTDAYADLDGLQMVKLNTSGADLISEAVSNTDGNSTAFTNFGATASTYNYVTGFQVFRTDSGTTPIYVDFRDGTGGSVLWRAVLPPNGGCNSPAYNGPGLFKTSSNTALAYDVSAATTTVYISVSGYKSKT